jgi:hypothetical protein
MQYHIIRMNFTAPLHLGNREGILESTLNHVPSDMLFLLFVMFIVYFMVKPLWRD